MGTKQKEQMLAARLFQLKWILWENKRNWFNEFEFAVGGILWNAYGTELKASNILHV